LLLLLLLPLPEHEPVARYLDTKFLLLLPAAWTRTCCPLPRNELAAAAAAAA